MVIHNYRQFHHCFLELSFNHITVKPLDLLALPGPPLDYLVPLNWSLLYSNLSIYLEFRFDYCLVVKDHPHNYHRFNLNCLARNYLELIFQFHLRNYLRHICPPLTSSPGHCSFVQPFTKLDSNRSLQALQNHLCHMFRRIYSKRIDFLIDCFLLWMHWYLKHLGQLLQKICNPHYC